MNPLGPPDGRYVLRSAPGAEARGVVVLEALGASPPPRRRLRPRRDAAAPENLAPSGLVGARATVVAAAGLDSRDEAEQLLARMRADRAARSQAVEEAVYELNGVLRAHRAAAADPLGRDVSSTSVAALRIGFGSGDQVSEGRSDASYEIPLRGRRAARLDLLAPQERLSSILSGRVRLPPSEELVLRARADVAAGRMREAALQARVALECLLVELHSSSHEDPGLAGLEAARAPVSDAASAAVAEDLSSGQGAAVTEAVEQMAAAVRRRAIGET